jgi:stage IV sporulation protein B
MIPLNVLAYSDYILAGGQNIGIELNSDGVLIVGTYKVDNNDPANDANLQVGDKIISINNEKVQSIEEMLQVISELNNPTSINITYLRGSKINSTILNLVMDDNKVYKTGLYVKDSINGVGTLTFIDPNTRIYGALGHEIIEKTTGQRLEIKDGKIYSSVVTGITPSNEGNPGEKNARYNISDVYGDIKENSSAGIFGTYTDDLPSDKLYKVAKPEDIKLGKASILTVVNDEKVEIFDINILKISHDNKQIKNILFEVTDEKLLKISGGIVQGMSGSPIIQDDMIIGAVTHVVVDDCTKGYGIFITNMLEEAEN